MASDGGWYPQQWEYTWAFQEGGRAVLDGIMNAAAGLGKQGWEMVNIATIVRPGRDLGLVAYFKRPIRAG
jgi:hypothetical protein